MKLKVIGWTSYDNMRFEEGENTPASHAAIVEDMKAHGYAFTGWHHQEAEYGAPVLSDGKLRRYSQRGWGGLMADMARENTEPYAYAHYAFSYGANGEEVHMPAADRDAEQVLLYWIRELLTEQEQAFLLEQEYTTRFPQPDAQERQIYTLTAEEAGRVSCFETVRQVPRCVMQRLLGEGVSEEFCLDAYDCTLQGDRISLKMQPALACLGEGDTVLLGGMRYTVMAVEQKRESPIELLRSLLHSEGADREEAQERFKQADVLLEIKIGS